MRNQYLLIDFENVQPKSLPSPSEFPLKVFVFVGAKQPNIPTELAKALQPYGRDGHYIRISDSGRNALDFHIALYLGALATKYPGSHFHIVSGDTGYDPLIRHLREQRVLVGRVERMEDLPFLPRSRKENSDRLSRWLRDRGPHRPRRLAGLRNSTRNHFRMLLGEDEVDALIEELERRGELSFDGEAVRYHDEVELPS